MYPKSKFAFLFLIVISFFSCERQNEVELKSPNSNYVFRFKINSESNGSYSLTYNGDDVVKPSNLGFQIEGVSQGKDIKIESVENKSVNSSWKPVYGEKNEYPDVYEEALISLSGKDAIFNLRVRAYNEGVAFRYEFPNMDSKIQINKELTEFLLNEDGHAWVSTRAQKPIVKTQISKIEGVVERPLLVELSDSLFVAIGEAALVDYARMKLSHDSKKPGTLVSELSSGVVMDTPFNSPWRFIMASNTPSEILENNYLLLNLNEENQLEDTSWIRPGKIIRESTLTTKGGYACVDFAAKHNLQFIEFDAGWYGNEYDETSDATTITIDPKRSNGPLDLLGVIDYAKSKNIDVILYVNRRALEKQLDDVLPLLSSWGVTGVKYGFVNVGPQEWTSWLHDAVRKAAEHKLMIDIHDEYRPTGYSRTYPNLMTQEGIRGDEEAPQNSMVLNTIFTRMIAGAGDQTNCYFAPRVTEEMGSHVSQLAKAVCIYSPWQFLYWYDRPEGSDADGPGAGGTKTFIQEVPELAFYDALPTVWDDTKILGGYPSEYGIVARQSGNDWFVGALTGTKGRKFEIALDFLEEGKSYEATIYSDDLNSDSITKVKIDKKIVKSTDTIRYNVLKQNGLALHIRAI
ncbi:glycoside hydrolase family 97 N-terminal domain-containing protein [Tamlana fucoidanivorans]|uniref:Glycoside hydrolase family 97 protein n=1 Tax=Allotamlana fucoidanivorans TaxID=2583814 RepID=A0A5C4SD47_9FLAO|nr:glycoside hydrolase family 97 protein [Tamlana fucoidanivorans]TNJ41495.1 glycoside hydrolase family 97 protein [Tamlana fucoidanivorans]